MTYEIIYSDDSSDFLEKASKDIKERIIKKLESVRNLPLFFFDRLSGRREYKLRVGSYRIIADIIKSDKRIEVRLIDHRDKIYKKLERLE